MSGNLLSNYRVQLITQSTAAGVGTTGSDAGPTGTTIGGTTTLVTGFPYSSTTLDMSGFTGVTFIALVSNSSKFQLSAGWANTSGAGATGFTQFASGGIQSGSVSTAIDCLAIDVVRPVKRWVNATVYIPTSSASLEGVIAIQYRAAKGALAAASTAYLVSNTAVIDGTTA